MGRGRKGPVEQSTKKPKWNKKGKKTFNMLNAVDVRYEETIFFKKELIEELKKNEPTKLNE